MPGIQSQITRYRLRNDKTELVHKVIKTAITIIFHMFKKVEKRISIIKIDIKSIKIN